MEQAHANGRQCMLPVLELQRFEDHLTKFNGVLEPTGSCSAISRWAYLLHALVIKPDLGIISWKPQVDGQGGPQEASIPLEMSGAMSGHIVNLYSCDAIEFAGQDVECSAKILRDVPCRSESFLGNAKRRMCAKFTPGPIDRINEVKKPLGRAGTLLYEANPQTFVFTYFDTLTYGVSDHNLRWPSPTSPLPERVRKLLDNINHLCHRLWTAETPLLLTYEWLEMASRIRRRVLRNGLEDEYSFLEDVLATIKNDPERESSWKDQYIRRTRAVFLSLKDRFLFFQGEDGGSGRSLARTDHVRQTLKGYSSEPVGSWKHQLYTMVDEVTEVWNLPQGIHLDLKARVLDFQYNDDLWKKTVLLLP
jgi:hypothetical protein